MFKQILRLSKHSAIYGLGVVASQLVGFFLLPLYTRYLTPSDYGILAILSATTSVLSIIFAMGLGSALFMSYFNYDDRKDRKKVVGTALVFLTVISLFFSLLLVALSGRFSLLFFGSARYTFYFQVIFLTIFFDTAIIVPMAVFRAREESKKYAVISLFRLLIGIGLNIFFIVALRKGVLGILESGLITAFLIYCSLVPNLIKSTKLRFSISDLKAMLSFGLPLVPANLASWILTLADRYFLQFFSTPNELGLYSTGYKFGLVIQGLIVGPFSLAWGPFLWVTAKQENAKKVYSSTLTYFILIGMFAALGLSVLSKEALILMTTPAFYAAYKVVPLIALSYILYGSYFILEVGIDLEKKTGYLPFIVGIGAIVNLGLNYLLIPSYGMMGAAVATVGSYFMLPIGSYFVSRKYYPVEYEWGRISKIFIASGLIYAGSTWIKSGFILIDIVLKLAALLTYPILLYGLKFYKPKEIRKAKESSRVVLIWIRGRLVKAGILQGKQ